MKRTLTNANKISIRQMLYAGELKEFKISDDLSVFADALEEDMVVFDSNNETYANEEFPFEGKVYKTGASGEIVSIEDDAKEDEKPEEETVAAAEEPATEPAPAPATEETDVAKLQEELEAAKKMIEQLEIENQELKAELSTVKEEAVQLAEQPRTDGKEVIIQNNKPKTTLEVIRGVLS